MHMVALRSLLRRLVAGMQTRAADSHFKDNASTSAVALPISMPIWTNYSFTSSQDTNDQDDLHQTWS